MCRLALCCITIIGLIQLSMAENRGLTTIGDHTYYISDSSRQSWQGAYDECNAMGMRLLSLENGDKNELIMSYFRANGMGLTSYWSGGRQSGGGWVWSGTGQSFSFTDWSAGQPDNANGNEAYVNFNAVDGWFDMPESLKIHFVCE